MQSTTVLTPSTSQSSLISNLTDEINNASPQELIEYLMEGLPDIDDHPKEIRAWVTLWLKCHDIDPSDERLAESINKISWTGTYIRQISARQLEDELMAWDFDYGYVSGIIKVIMDVRKVENRGKISIFFINMIEKFDQLGQRLHEQFMQIASATYAYLRKDIEIYIVVYLVLLVACGVQILTMAASDAWVGKEVSMCRFVTMLAVAPVSAFCLVALSKFTRLFDDRTVHGISRCLGLGKEKVGKNNDALKQEDFMKQEYGYQG